RHHPGEVELGTAPGHAAVLRLSRDVWYLLYIRGRRHYGKMRGQGQQRQCDPRTLCRGRNHRRIVFQQLPRWIGSDEGRGIRPLGGNPCGRVCKGEARIALTPPPPQTGERVRKERTTFGFASKNSLVHSDGRGSG